MRFTYTYRSSDGLRHGLRPRRRPVDRAAVGKRHHLRQLAARGQVAGDVRVVGGVIADIGEPLMRIKDKNLLPEFLPNKVKWCDEVRIATKKRKAIRSVTERIKKHVCRNVYVGALFLELDDAHTSVIRLIACSTPFSGSGHPRLIPVIVSFYDLKSFNGCKRTQIDSLTLNCCCVMRICSDPCSVELDVRKNMVFSKQGSDESNGIEPFHILSLFEQPVIQISCINVCDCFHVCKMLRPRPFRIGASPRIGRASRSDVNPSRGSGVVYQIDGWHTRGDL